MLRLSPSAPPLWRDDDRLQFGADGAVVIDAVASWIEPAVQALEDGTSRPALRALVRLHGGADDDADAFLGRLAPVLVPTASSVPTVLQVSDDLAPPTVRAVLAGLPRGTAVRPWAGRRSEPVRPGSRVVLLGAHRVDPRRTVRLIADDIVHVPLAVDGARATVGPVVVPGQTACLVCLDASARAADPSWPLIAAQLLARARPRVDTAFAAEAGRAAAHLLSRPVEPPSSASLHLRVDALRRSWRRHLPSADCRCRSLEGSATASARSDRARVTS